MRCAMIANNIPNPTFNPMQLVHQHQFISHANYFLHTLHEQTTCQWINNNHNIFTLYMLRRMYKAHKKNEEIMIHKNDLENIIQSMPDASFNIQECIKQYLLLGYKKSLLEHIQTYYEICAHECKKAYDWFKF